MPSGHERHLKVLGFVNNADYRDWCGQNGLRTTVHKTWVERRDEARLRARQQRIHAQQAETRAQAKRLGFGTVTAYLAWCEANRFSQSLSKTAAQFQTETETRAQEAARVAMREARILSNRPEIVLEAILRGNATPRMKADPRFAPVILALARKCMKGKTREQYADLLRYALRHTRLMLTSRAACSQYGEMPSNTFAYGLSRVAELHAEWRRPLSDWKRPNTDPLTQFRSLVHHLFGEYETPDFLISGWFEPDEAKANEYRLWALTLAAGGNLKSFTLPIALTSKERHALLYAPDNLIVPAALRWAQTVGRGATPPVAKAILQSRLREVLPDEPFWDTAVRFFVNHRVPPAHIPRIVDYLFAQKFERNAVRFADGTISETHAEQPEFTLKGRTATSLIRLAEEWHRDVMRFSLSTVREWRPMQDVSSLEIEQKVSPHNAEGVEIEPKTEVWRVLEILNTRELHAEGVAQHNCVATYHSDCLSAESAIWSVRRWTEGKPTFQRVLTVEVNPTTRQIVQIRGRLNSMPRHKPDDALLQTGLAILQRWAAKNGLAIADYA